MIRRSLTQAAPAGFQLRKMKLIELLNDHTLIGFGLLTIQTPFASRSLIGIFWQKEQQEVWIDFLFINLKIKVG